MTSAGRIVNMTNLMNDIRRSRLQRDIAPGAVVRPANIARVPGNAVAL